MSTGDKRSVENRNIKITPFTSFVLSIYTGMITTEAIFVFVKFQFIVTIRAIWDITFFTIKNYTMIYEKFYTSIVVFVETFDTVKMCERATVARTIHSGSHTATVARVALYLDNEALYLDNKAFAQKMVFLKNILKWVVLLIYCVKISKTSDGIKIQIYPRK